MRPPTGYIQTADVEERPTRLGISDELVYIAHEGSETVLMIPLGQVGKEGAPVPVVDFPGGQAPLGAVAGPGLADIIIQAPGANAVLLANSGDQAILLLPRGHGGTHGGVPKLRPETAGGAHG